MAGRHERIALEHDLEDVVRAAVRRHFEVDVRRHAAVRYDPGLIVSKDHSPFAPERRKSLRRGLRLSLAGLTP